MAVTASMIKELRELTGVGMSDCKKALVEVDGNIEKAVEFLREQGLAAAQKKAGRVAAEGLVKAYVEGNTGVVVEVNSETDFVSKNQIFIDYVEEVAKSAVMTKATDIEGFLKDEWTFSEAETVQDAVNAKIAVIGENLSLRRFGKIVANDGETLITYIHGGGKVAVLLHLVCEKSTDEVVEAGKNISMQIAAMNPKFVDKSEMSEEFISHEKEILTQQALNEGTDPKFVDKKVIGRLNKQLKEFCLLDQEYVKGDKQTVEAYVKEVSDAVGFDVKVKAFVRFETGEGIEKKEENFAEEVAKTMGA
ncbi:MAG: translation elongation factor Ts [Lachnospirales bacterium]